MGIVTKLTLLVLAILVLQTTALPSRVRRQGFNWSDYDEDIRFSSTTTTRRPRPSNPSSAPSNGGTTTTTASPQYTACVRRCPTTPQYNPICGTNRVTYNNESHLKCAVNCGLNVQRAFGGTCQPL